MGLEVLKALVEVFGSNVALKVSPAGGYNDMGYVRLPHFILEQHPLKLRNSMPLQDTLDTFRYFLSEADKLGLSYIVIARYLAWLDIEFDGKSRQSRLSLNPALTLRGISHFTGVKRATPHDVLASYRDVVKKSKFFVNAGVSPEEAETLISSGTVDGAFFGISFITHSDLVKRVQNGKPLDNAPNYAHLYGVPGVDIHVGFTDYPIAA